MSVYYAAGMPASDIATALDQALAGLRLLDHPYYRSWQEGSLSPQDLASYAGQYRHFERCLPEVLSTLAAQLPDGPCRERVEGNLHDELSRPCPHLELFEAFAAEVGAPAVTSPTPAASALVNLYRGAALEGPVPALAVIAAYERQAGDIAATKASALSKHHQISATGTQFWTVHAEVEQEHAAWTSEALQLLDATPSSVQLWAERSAGHWWTFLDEREADRAA